MITKKILLSVLIMMFLASIVVAYPIHINFSDNIWEVKTGYDGPGNNIFSSSAVYVDPNGHLHLKIFKSGSTWYCSEVINEKSKGYGTYIFTVKSRVDLLDKNVVLGLFTWDVNSAACYREIDIEYAKWGVASNDNGYYSVQPWGTSGHQHIYDVNMADKSDVTTNIFTWESSRIRFKSYYGPFVLEPAPEDIITSWTYNGTTSPAGPGTEKTRMNLWLYDYNGDWNGDPPSDGQNVDVIVQKYMYLPSVPSTFAGDLDLDNDVDLTDFSLFAAKWLTSVDCNQYNNFCGWTDTNFDGQVAFDDLAMMADNWLRGTFWHWKLDETSGTTAHDSSINAEDGIVNGDPNWTTGQINGALDFNGDDNVDITGSSGTGSPLNIYEKNMSISAWVNFRGAGTIVARAKSSYITYRLAISTGNQVYLNTYKSGVGHWYLIADGTLDPNTWYHIVGVFDRASDVGSIYINGINKGEGAMPIDPASNDATTKIGCRNSASDDSFNGKIDDVRIYNKALNLEQIQRIYQHGLNGLE